MKRPIQIITVACVCLIVFGCAPKARKAGGFMDDPKTHYTQGMKYFNDDLFVKAEEEFKLATSLDAKFGPAYAGLGLVEAQRGNANKANDNFGKARSLAEKMPDVYIAHARGIALLNQGTPVDKWIDKVEELFEKALKLSPNNAEVFYRRGVCYKKGMFFKSAARDFAKVLDLKGDYTKEADEQWQIVQMIERAAPGTEVGKKIALVEKISRSDIAALFITELNVTKLIDKKRVKNYETGYQAPTDSRTMKVDSAISMAAVTDMSGHWAKNFVMDVVDLSIRGLEPYPDHTFHPDQGINRGEYALMVEDVIVAILRDPSLSTKHIGTTSRFPDVNPSHPAYNAICTAVDKGILAAEMNGEFGLIKSVSGPEALLVIRKLKELNK